MISREDRRLFGLPEESGESEEESDDQQQQQQQDPNPPLQPNPDRIFDEETEIPLDNSHFRVFCKKIPFRRQMRYGFEDSHFEYVKSTK